MIRIDLGKAEGGQKGGKKSLLDEIRGRLQSFGSLTGGRSSRRSRGPDPKYLFLVGLALAMAWLPHLFFTQFRQFVIDEHIANKKKLEENLATLTAEVAKFQPFQAELNSYKEQKNLVKTRLDIVYNLLSNRGTPVNVLDAVGQNLPRRTWIQDLELVATPTVQKLAITGQSYSNEDISDYIDKLTESVYFSDVKLEDVGQARVDNNIDVRTYRISAKPKVTPMGNTANRATTGTGAAAAPAAK